MLLSLSVSDSSDLSVEGKSLSNFPIIFMPTVKNSDIDHAGPVQYLHERRSAAVVQVLCPGEGGPTERIDQDVLAGG